MIDPYRTLGLEAGTPMAEVKRAYRRLAKAYHPDSAGEGALPRFLAIHEAYEAIRTGRPFAPGTPTGAAASRPAGSAARAEPWRADPDRARAARDRARRRAGASPPGAGAGASTGAKTGGTSGTSGRTGSGGRTGTSGEARPRSGRRHVRKATMGSTSYDEARDPKDPNDPTWSGASWYGPSTGEYWIINPREYADPRKHGPEYQSRARRMAAAAALGESPTEEQEFPPGAPAPDRAREPEAEAVRGAASDTSPDSFEAAPATGRAARSFRTDARRRSASTARAEPLTAQSRAPGSWGTTWPADARSMRRGAGHRNRLPSPRDWVGGPSDDPVRRLGIALVAWPPIGLAAAALIGDVTGCAMYSAECGGTEPLLPWLAQAVILGLLLLLPPVARILAGGAVGALVGLVPLTAILVAVGGSGEPQAGFALSFFLAVAWLAGVAWAVAQARRPVAGRAGP